MKNLLCCFVLGMLFAACHNDGPYKGGNKDLMVPADFSWKTLERQEITLDQPGSVYLTKANGEEVLVGENLEAGKYTFTVGNGKLTQKAVAQKSNLSRAKDDDVPNGHSMAYFPSEEGWAMMMVEDVFPWTGDLDMNDVVFNFRVEYELNRKNQDDPGVWGMTIRIRPVALGGTQYKQIGLGLNFVGKDMKQTLSVNKVEGQFAMDAMDKDGKLMFSLDKGVESGEEYVVPLIGNLYETFKDSPKEGILNTYSKLPKYEADEIVVTVKFSKEPKLSQVQLTPDKNGNMMDLFVTFGTRGTEVHLKGHSATGKMNPKLLQHSNNRDYASPENWVWALILDTPLKYPQESVAIYDAYPDFKDWVNGELPTTGDWTSNVNHDLVY